MNIAYAQVNPLCSCQSSIAVLIVGRRKLALLQSGMAFSVSSAFIFIISIIFVDFASFSVRSDRLNDRDNSLYLITSTFNSLNL